MKNRRQILAQSAALAGLVATAAWLPATALAYSKDAFDAKSVADALKAVGAGTPTESKDVTITGPDIAENGAVVPLSVGHHAAGVKQLMLLVEKNPNAWWPIFNTSEFVEPNFTTRAKMASPRTCMPWRSCGRQGLVREEGSQGHARRLRLTGNGSTHHGRTDAHPRPGFQGRRRPCACS
jgi:sulfur-oxidizing protein SoxY